MRLERVAFSDYIVGFSFLKQFELLYRCSVLGRVFAIKNLNSFKLFIRNLHNTDRSMLGKKALYSSDMHICIFRTWTMPQIDGKLEHPESVFHETFPKCSRGSPLLFGLRREIIQYENPHYSIFAKTIQHRCQSCGLHGRIGDFSTFAGKTLLNGLSCAQNGQLHGTAMSLYYYIFYRQRKQFCFM